MYLVGGAGERSVVPGVEGGLDGVGHHPGPRLVVRVGHTAVPVAVVDHHTHVLDERGVGVARQVGPAVSVAPVAVGLPAHAELPIRTRAVGRL